MKTLSGSMMVSPGCDAWPSGKGTRQGTRNKEKDLGDASAEPADPT